jgi:hypothetical protein
MVTISWISTSGGDWSDPANWQGGVVPGATDAAVMNLSAIETITISTPQSVQAVSFEDPAATFVITGTGILAASVAVTLDVASISIDGDLSGALVQLGAGSHNGGDVVIETGLVAPGVLDPIPIGPLGSLEVGYIVPDPLNTVSPSFIDTPLTLIDDGAPLVQPVIAVVPSNSPVAPSSPTIPASGGGRPFDDAAGSPFFLNGHPPGATAILAIPVGLALRASTGMQTVSGAGDGAVVTAAAFRSEVLAAGTGNETLIAGAGSDTLAAGVGTAQMVGGSGSALFLFSDGEAGGTVTISNFVHGQDFVALRNYGVNAVQDALTTASVATGSMIITLPDNSRITFVNVATLTPVDFH